MEEINLTDLLKYYLKKLPIIILVTLLAALIGYYYVEEIQVPLYHGTTSIILVQNSNGSVSETQNELTINEKLVSTYSEIIKSRRVLEQVIERLNLDITYSDLSSNITVSNVDDTSIIKITVSDESSKLAVKIANATAEIFKDEIVTIYELENVSIIDEAVVEDEPYNISLLKQIVIFSLGGIVLSCGVIFMMYYFDSSIKNKKEIETALNLAVLGEVPIAKKLVSKSSRTQELVETVEVDEEEFNKIDKKSTSTLEKDAAKTTTKSKTTKSRSTAKSKKVLKEEGGE